MARIDCSLLLLNLADGTQSGKTSAVKPRPCGSWTLFLPRRSFPPTGTIAQGMLAREPACGIAISSAAEEEHA